MSCILFVKLLSVEKVPEEIKACLYVYCTCAKDLYSYLMCFCWSIYQDQWSNGHYGNSLRKN